jgi:hypothetical protein
VKEEDSAVTAVSGRGMWDSMSDSSRASTATPTLMAAAAAVAARPSVAPIAASKDYLANIYEFREMCVDKTETINPRPLRGGRPEHGGRVAVGELQSAINPTQKSAGNFSPPVSPDAPPCVQKTLASHYPVSRLNPMPEMVSLIREHRAGQITQGDLWRSIQVGGSTVAPVQVACRSHRGCDLIQVTRGQWEAEKCDAERRVHEQRARRAALLQAAQEQQTQTEAMNRLRAARITSTSSAPSKLQGGGDIPPAHLDTFLEASDLRRDGTAFTGVVSSDGRADSVLARLAALTSPAPSRGSSSARSASRAATNSPFRARVLPPRAHRYGTRSSLSYASSGSRSGSCTSRTAGQPSRRASTGTPRLHNAKGHGPDTTLADPAVYQETRPGTFEVTTSHTPSVPPAEQTCLATMACRSDRAVGAVIGWRTCSTRRSMMPT